MQNDWFYMLCTGLRKNSIFNLASQSSMVYNGGMTKKGIEFRKPMDPLSRQEPPGYAEDPSSALPEYQVSG